MTEPKKTKQKTAKKQRPQNKNLIGQGFDDHPERINKKGRPKGVSIVAEMKKLAGREIKNTKTGETVVQAKAIAMTILNKATQGDARFAQMVLDRIDGTAMQNISVFDATDEAPGIEFVIDEVPDEG